jgi:hypothetical protein
VADRQVYISHIRRLQSERDTLKAALIAERKLRIRERDEYRRKVEWLRSTAGVRALLSAWIWALSNGKHGRF